MDYKQELYYGMPSQNITKMPFYMAYPMQTVYMEELEYTKDMQKLKELYPKEVRSVQEMVEDECDKMEYEGSLMFDETPDRLMLRQVVDRLYDAVSGPAMDIKDFESEQYEDHMQAEELPMEGTMAANRYPGMMQPTYPGMHPHRNNGTRNMIEVLLYNEMYQRRCRHKRCRRWW